VPFCWLANRLGLTDRPTGQPAGWSCGLGWLNDWMVFFADVATSYRLDDMMSILFPHLCEDVEFLLPPDADVEMGDFSGVSTGEGGNASTNASGSASSYAASPSRADTTNRPVRIQENAVAGPSRLG
jgi:hypothetical protein